MHARALRAEAVKLYESKINRPHGTVSICGKPLRPHDLIRVFNIPLKSCAERAETLGLQNERRAVHATRLLQTSSKV